MKLKCSRCGCLKDQSAFNKNGTTKRGYHYWCKDCVRKNQADRYAKNPSKQKESSSKYRSKHQHANKKYRIENKEKEKSRRVKYYNENKEKEKLRMAEWRARNPDWRANYHKNHPEKRKENKLRKYNLTIGEYNELLQKQNGKCAICGTSGDSKNTFPCVDHCHNTGIVRGLLCKYCNASLGLMRDDPQLFEKAAQYIYNFKKLRMVSNVI